MSIKLGNVPTIVVSSPEAVKLFLETHNVVFASRPKLQFADYISYCNKGLVFAPYGSYWRTMRKWCTLRKEVESLVDRIKRAATSGQVVDLSAKAIELMENIMYRMIIGRSKDVKFDLKPLIQESLKLSRHFNIADYVTFLVPFDLQSLLPLRVLVVHCFMTDSCLKEEKQELFLLVYLVAAKMSFSPPPSPIFVGENYNIWAVKMKKYLQAHDLWNIIQNDTKPPPLRANPTIAQIG
ncbi:cytochrome P450 CYP736A12-like [Gossypium arboreum]|uniref:cytochrome P450 CYP736A12-like n=1 Tax=Gossypium arboreum TaxID=29729 RepID=UPI0008191B19|nr:cytochrome P450 CYP736A12-like [Gossypium arboreum]